MSTFISPLQYPNTSICVKLLHSTTQYNCSAPQYQALFTTLQYLVPLHQGISLPVPLLLINALPSVTLYQSLSTSITLPQYQSLSTWYHSSTLPVLQCHRFFCAGLYLSVSQYQCHTSTVPVLQYLALQHLAVPCLTVPVPAAPVMLHCVVPSAAVQQLRGQRDNLYSYTGFARYFTFSPNFSSLGISSFSDFNPGYFLLVIPPPA